MSDDLEEIKRLLAEHARESNAKIGKLADEVHALEATQGRLTAALERLTVLNDWNKQQIADAQADSETAMSRSSASPVSSGV